MSNAPYERCGPDSGIRLFSLDDRWSPAPTVKGCRHGQAHWHHVHWRLNGQAMCRIECRCGRVMASDGRVGAEASESAWWREGLFGPVVTKGVTAARDSVAKAGSDRFIRAEDWLRR